MGFDASDTAALVTIARHHLLLPDTAARRDLEDPATAEFVASVVDDPMVLELLAAVAEADGTATGPTAWCSLEGPAASPSSYAGPRPCSPELGDAGGGRRRVSSRRPRSSSS